MKASRILKIFEAENFRPNLMPASIEVTGDFWPPLLMMTSRSE